MLGGRSRPVPASSAGRRQDAGIARPFALDHADLRGMGLRRVIYVIPFTSIVEQNAQVFREALGDLGDAAGWNTTALFFDDRSSVESKEETPIGDENWDAPIVVYHRRAVPREPVRRIRSFALSQVTQHRRQRVIVTRHRLCRCETAAAVCDCARRVWR